MSAGPGATLRRQWEILRLLPGWPSITSAALKTARPVRADRIRTDEILVPG